MDKITARRREKIMDYVNRQPRTDPLSFHGVQVIYDGGLRGLILCILRLANNYGSYNSSGQLETSSGRARSSFDIWRHVKRYNPEIDIFTVMEELYSMRARLSGRYCYVVKRGVFRVFNNWIDSNLEFGTFISREYMISFRAWEKLH